MDPALIEKIVQEVLRRLRAEMASDASAIPLPPPKKVVVEADVLDALRRGERVIRVLPGAIVTPLARDTMREKGVRTEVVER